MDFSLMTYTVAPGQPGGLQTLEEMADFAAELGFGALELSAGNLDGRPASEFGAICRDRGLAVSCVNGGANLTAGDDADFADGIDRARSYIETATTLDCPVIMIVPARAAGIEDKPRALARMAEGLRVVVEEAAGAGVTVTVEDFPNLLTPCSTIAEMQELLALVPGLMLNYDNGNWIVGGDDPVEAARVFAGRIANVHIKDWEPDPDRSRIQTADGSWIRGGLHGEGIIDQRAVLQALIEAGYDGWLAYEYEGVMDHVEATRRGMAYLREVMEELN
ncbi:MAG: sugar phosphate isomerase/epimerase [Armatimonadetes bacterium]|nr:sugar phosphate isomerase/epimerase [Armatimonadota bacterium]